MIQRFSASIGLERYGFEPLAAVRAARATRPGSAPFPIVVAFAYGVWPTPYRYDCWLGQFPVRLMGRL